MPSYNIEFKEAMVSKICMPNGPSAYQLGIEKGISTATLHNWVKKFSGDYQVNKNKKPEDWESEEKLKAVFGAEGLKDQELGAFLRKNGLHSHHIEEWKKEAFAVIKEGSPKVGRPRKDPELAEAQMEIKALKRDLRRKEKALAEQTAIVILQKKAKELWGSEEDDE